MEDLTVTTALNYSGSFGKNFAKFEKTIKCYSPELVEHLKKKDSLARHIAQSLRDVTSLTTSA